MQITVNGITLYYEVTGDKKPLILLHGNDEDHTLFNGLVSKLKNNHQVFTLDTRDFGLSEQNCPLSYDLMATDLAHFISKLKIFKPIIYGFSDGGIIALLFAIKYPNLVDRLIVSGVNIHPFGLKLNVYRYYLFEYIKTKDPKLLLMLSSPWLKRSELRSIKAEVIMIVGADDVIRLSHTKLIAKCILKHKLIVIDHEDHASYIIDNDKLYDIILPYLSDDTIIDPSR